MKTKILDLRTLTVGVLVLAVALAFVPVASAVVPATTWSMLGSHGITFTCGGSPYPHTMVVDDEDLYAGTFSGTGTYDPNNAYTWDVNGTITGNAIAFTIVYTGLAPGSTYNSVGTIAGDGSISGTTDSNCEAFAMAAGTATDADLDDDGVLFGDDFCEDTEADEEWL